MDGQYGFLMSCDTEIHNVFLGSTSPANRIVYDRESGEFVVAYHTDVRAIFIETTGSNLSGGSGVSLETMPTKDDVSYRAVPI